MTTRTWILPIAICVLGFGAGITAEAAESCKTAGGATEAKIQRYLNELNADYTAAHKACNASTARTVEELKKECSEIYRAVHTKHEGPWKKELGLCLVGEHA